MSGDIASLVLNQARLRPLFGKLCAVAMMIPFEVYLFFLNSRNAYVSWFFLEVLG